MTCPEHAMALSLTRGPHEDRDRAPRVATHRHQPVHIWRPRAHGATRTQLPGRRQPVLVPWGGDSADANAGGFPVPSLTNPASLEFVALDLVFRR